MHFEFAGSLSEARFLVASLAAGHLQGVPAPLPATVPPAPTSAPLQAEEDDMAIMIRLEHPGHPQHGRTESVTAMHRRWIPTQGEIDAHRFLGGAYIGNCTLAAFNQWTSNKAPVGTNPINGPIK